MRTVSIVLLLGIFVAVSSPASAFFGDKFKKVDVGMSYEKVQKILGKPDGKQQHGDYVAWKYVHRMAPGWNWDRADYFVVFKQEKVVEYGPGDLRTKDVRGVRTFVIVPLPPPRR